MVAPRWLIASVVLVAISTLNSAELHAAVSAQLSQSVIDELETVRLTVRASGTRDTEAIDLKPLEKDFHVMGTNTSSQYRYVNGREQSWVDYQITLQPKRTGDLTIPEITVGKDRTPTITLSVRKLSATARQIIDELAFFETEVSAPEVYVQAELLYTRRLLYSNGVQLYSDLPGAPEIADAVVLVLGETTSKTTERDGRMYGVVEQRYAIFPESSGTLTIPGISVTASVRLVDGGRVSRKGVRVGTQDEAVTVKPVPGTYPANQSWLPAKSVRGLQVLSPNDRGYQVGDSLTHELLVHIEGNIGSMAPPVELPLTDGTFRIYPQSPVMEDDTDGSSVRGSRLQTASLVPLKPGNLEIPPMTISWWNTVTDQLEETRIESLSMRVTGTALSTTPLENAVAEAESEQTASDNGQESSFPRFDRTTAVVLFLLIGGLLALLYAWRRLQLHAWIRRLSERVGQFVKLPFGERSANAQLRQALGTKVPDNIQHALHAYICKHYNAPLSVALRKFRASSEAADCALDALDQCRYTASGRALASADIQHIESALRQLGTQTKRIKTALPPLYAS